MALASRPAVRASVAAQCRRGRRPRQAALTSRGYRARPEAGERPGNVSGNGGAGTALRGGEPEPDQRLGEPDRCGDAVDHRQPVAAASAAASSAMPAQPSTIASAPSSAIARSISADSLCAPPTPGSSSASTGTSQARTRAQRGARPYFVGLASIGAIERDRRDDAKAMGDERGDVERRFADADHPPSHARNAPPRGRCRRTGDDKGVEAGGVALRHFRDQPRRG